MKTFVYGVLRAASSRLYKSISPKTLILFDFILKYVLEYKTGQEMRGKKSTTKVPGLGYLGSWSAPLLTSKQRLWAKSLSFMEMQYNISRVGYPLNVRNVLAHRHKFCIGSNTEKEPTGGAPSFISLEEMLLMKVYYEPLHGFVSSKCS